MENTEINLVQSIVEIAKDYQGGGVVTVSRVKKWIEQFDSQYHVPILTELSNILGKTYVSKEVITNFFEIFLGEKRIFCDSILKYQFINPQTIGNSQKELLSVLDRIIQEKYNISISECGKEDVLSYIYIDDGIYSGNRVIRDLQNWSRSFEDVSDVSRVDIVVLAIHNRNIGYIKKELEKVLPKTKFHFWRVLEFEDSIRDCKYKYESYWPSAEMDYASSTIEYLDGIIDTRSDLQNAKIPLLRRNGEPNSDDFFTNPTNRSIVEKAFLEKGVEIVTYATNPNPNMRPMGYDNSRTIGFGSYFVTYRNIANNCPVVLWWGDPEADTGVNNWYPLFPRITN
ncbi:phosphoribosyltransferase-like protein [Lysinibacillus sp. RS11]|uniref:phosphoribosyltransferase-like protein n=1 Tax=Lysinibacillus sp. RS11 TaxID=3242682 RepID=UPI0035C6EA85